MLITISPAKKLDMSPVKTDEVSEPIFKDQTAELVEIMQKLDTADLRKLMKISENLAAVNAERYANFDNLPGKQALFCFAGDTYTGLDATSLDADEIERAQSHLRILSGLYGVLRPLDKIRPYRLEMGSRLKTPRGRNLYDFWSKQIAFALNRQASQVNTEFLVNCASKEYFSAVDPEALSLTVITPMFYEERPNGEPKIISFHAKRARGAMARYIIGRRLTDPESLLDFDTGGYKYNSELSSKNQPAFLRAA